MKQTGETKILRRRLANAYLSTVISISLVLLLVGIASLLMINAKGVSDYFKEHMQISVIMKDDVTDEQTEFYQMELDAFDFVRSTRLVTREQGAEEMKSMLGEDFLSVFETSPIPASIDLTLNAGYVSRDSLDKVKAMIEKSPMVEEVSYQQSLIEALNDNLGKIAISLGIFIALLMFISYVLINNTVRLNVFSRRFSIHTMKLVGATRSFIRSPFLVQSVFLGLFSGFIAVVLLLAGLFVVRNGFTQLFEIFRMELLLLVIGIVMVSGVVICLLSTYFAVNKLVSLTKDELYY